jgi:hypothetical protein
MGDIQRRQRGCIKGGRPSRKIAWCGESKCKQGEEDVHLGPSSARVINS